ncbi:MAG: DUF134 domain-containing protein [Desulfobacterales bacterium]|nr:DUF134 domain-containing protein [Desulfobacterales bacterium]
MARPQKDRIVAFNPNVSYFKPRGIPLLELDEVGLTVDGREAIRLADLQGLSHEEAGKRMGVSRATFGRIVQRARQAVADALINGKAINVEGGNYRLADPERRFTCDECGRNWVAPQGSGRPEGCPECSSDRFYRTSKQE